MNIAVDTTSFGHDEVRRKCLVNSTSLFTADLLDGFAALGKAGCFTLIVNESHEEFFRQRFPQYRLLVLKWLPLSLLRTVSGGTIAGTKYIKKLSIYRRAAEKAGFDLLWFPFTVSYSVVKTNITSVFTVHDLFRFHELNETYGFDFIADDRNCITAISSCTKKDIQQSLRYKKEITVIPNSVRCDVSDSREIPEVKGKFILDINAYIEKKNPMTLLKAFFLIADRTECSLVFCGGYKDETLFRTMQEYIREQDLEKRVHLLFRIPSEQKNWLLKNATLFVTPSLYEGFGRTPVEAALCKVPVISTKETSLYEATMGLASYVEHPRDENELASLMLQKLETPESAERLAFISQTLEKEYAPETCAQKYMELFMDILNGTSGTTWGGVLTSPHQSHHHCLPAAA